MKVRLSWETERLSAGWALEAPGVHLTDYAGDGVLGFPEVHWKESVGECSWKHPGVFQTQSLACRMEHHRMKFCFY